MFLLDALYLRGVRQTYKYRPCTGCGQNNGNAKMQRNRIFILATLKVLYLATLNAFLPFIHSVVLVSVQ
jgi:hypothetical protein